jgi:hypothetical protein
MRSVSAKALRCYSSDCHGASIEQAQETLLKKALDTKAMITRVVISLLLASFAATDIQAQVVDYTITGTVGGEYDNAGLFGPPGAQQVVGDPFTASFEFNLADSAPVSGFQSVSGQSALLADALTINGHTLANFGQSNAWAFYEVNGDQQQLFLSADAGNGTYLDVVWSSSSGNLPVTSLSSYGTYALTQDGTGPTAGASFGYGYDASAGTFETSMALAPSSLTVSPAPVPIPSTAWLLLSGLGALSAVSRNRRHYFSLVTGR